MKMLKQGSFRRVSGLNLRSWDIENIKYKNTMYFISLERSIVSNSKS